MPITFTGTYPNHKRIETGCLSLDWAIAGQDFQGRQLLGMPLRCGYHIYSQKTGLGKTSLSLALLGLIAAEEKKGLVISPVDTFDPGNLEVILTDMGFSGEVTIILDGEHPKMLTNLIDAYQDKNICGALLDSVHSCVPTSEAEGDVGDSNMGKAAQMMAQFVRSMYAVTNNPRHCDKTFILTNALFPDFKAPRKGFGPPPMMTSRGRTPNDLTSLHFKLTQQYRKNKAVQEDEGRLVHGVIEKNNFGPTKREFDVYMVGGHGIHRGLTAVFDCLSFGLAQDKTGGKVEVNGYSAKLSKMISEWNTFDFTPFTDAIAEFKKEIVAGKQVKTVKPEVVEEDFEETPEEMFDA